MKNALAILLCSACACVAADKLELKSGERREGRITAFDDRFIRLEIELPQQAGQSNRPLATIAIPRADIQAIDFFIPVELDQALHSAQVQNVPLLEQSWEKFQPWLEMPKSPSGAIACSLGNALLATKDNQNAKRALALFTLVEEKSPQDSDKVRAREGRLRAMLATGKSAEAIDEARTLAAESENPEIVLEMNYVMAQAAAKDMESFLTENPRWNIDPAVIDERHRIYNRALELFLQPALFYGSETEKASRGLWGAVGIYQLAAKNAREAGIPDLEKSSTQLAIETSRDITTLYPSTPEAKSASTYLAGLAPDLLAVNFEAEARAELHETGAATTNASPSPTPTPQAENSPAPKTSRTKKSKKNEK